MNDFDCIRQTSIGTVDAVSAKEIRVLLEIQAPQNVALNTGIPTRFPRINGYVLIPNEVGALVGMITYIAIEHSKYPARKGMKDFDLIDLPYPLRKMYVTPVGTLSSNVEGKYKLDRGVFSFPSVGDTVVIPSADQELAIIEIGEDNAAVYIGDSAQNTGVKIKVDPDKLFGRHLAILGNTGSGKSCTVAGLVRWALEAAQNELTVGNTINSRFIILDPNGEYSKAFSGIDDPIKASIVKYQVHLPEHKPDGSQPFQVPAWMWNSKEWISYTRAAPGIQRPILIDALSGIKAHRDISEIPLFNIYTALKSYRLLLEISAANIADYSNGVNYFKLGDLYNNFHTDILAWTAESSTYPKIASSLNDTLLLLQKIDKELIKPKTEYKKPFSQLQINELINSIKTVESNFPEKITNIKEVGPDNPIHFSLDDMRSYIAASATNEDRDMRNFTASLEFRISSLFTDIRLVSMINPPSKITLSNWINDFLGIIEQKMTFGRISIIDLSLVPSDIIHMVIAIFSRLIFEALQRYRRINNKELPTVLVLEEAHTFVRQAYSTDDLSYGYLSQEIFEKISREGRKFGLGLVLSSQRPSELSQTVLSQCNTFILHRLVNDKDQEQVKRLVPDNVGALLDELPNLPTRKAIMLGWATQIPVIMNVRELPENQRPHSADPQFWDVWTRTEKGERKMNWDTIADDWQGQKI